MAQSPNDSLLRHVAPVAAGAHVVAAAFLDTTPAFALGDGTILLAGPVPQRVRAHPDAAVLVAAAGGGALFTGGDDGRVVATTPDGVPRQRADEAGRWIDALAARPDGAIAWSCGKTVRAQEAARGQEAPRGQEAARGQEAQRRADAPPPTTAFDAPSTVRGLAFFRKGFRLAAAHYNGVSLWYPNAVAKPDLLEWKGSHLDATVAPDGRFIITSMQENTLHGWRLPDLKNMRMAGYPAKTRSLSWSHDGEWLATSGAEASVVWPFQTKDGPMGRGPRECGVRAAKVTQVAFHPASLVLAIGYEDGWVLLCRLTDGSELLVRAPGAGRDPVSALAWDGAGARLAFGTQKGEAGVLALPRAM